MIKPYLPNPAYSVGSDGVIYGVKNKPLKPAVHAKTGYHYVNLYYDKKPRSRPVHQLVCETYHPYPDDGLTYEPNHENGKKGDNRESNLRWTTRKQNIQHSYDTDGIRDRTKVGTAWKGKLGKEHNRSIPIMIDGVHYAGYSEAARETKINIRTIHYRVHSNSFPTYALGSCLAVNGLTANFECIYPYTQTEGIY